MRQILSSTKDHCCSTIEILCPCSEEELGYLVDFLVNGEIQCENWSGCLKIQENLQKIFGFPNDLNLSNMGTEKVIEAADNDLSQSNSVFNLETFSVKDDIEIVTEAEEQFENVLELTHSKKDHRELENENKIGSQGAEKTKGKKITSKCTCNYCGLYFYKKSKLKTHIEGVHLKLKPFQCDKCKALFSHQSTLTRHNQTVHLKSKPIKFKDYKSTINP